MNKEVPEQLVEAFNELARLVELLLKENEELRKDIAETIVVVNYPKRSA